MTPEDIKNDYQPESRLLLNAIDDNFSQESIGETRNIIVDCLRAALHSRLRIDALAEKTFKDFVAQSNVRYKCELHKGIQWLLQTFEELEKTLKHMQAILSVAVCAQLSEKEETDFPTVLCWNGQYYKFYVRQEDIPVVRKEEESKLREKLLENVPETLKDVFDVKFGFRKLQGLVKKLDEQGLSAKDFGIDVDTKMTLMSREKK